MRCLSPRASSVGSKEIAKEHARWTYQEKLKRPQRFVQFDTPWTVAGTPSYTKPPPMKYGRNFINDLRKGKSMNRTLKRVGWTALIGFLTALLTFFVELNSLWSDDDQQTPSPSVSVARDGAVAGGSGNTAIQGSGNIVGNGNTVLHLAEVTGDSRRNDDLARNLLGVWSSEYQFDGQEETQSWSGRMRYTEGGLYNYDGRLVLRTKKNGHVFVYTLKVKNNGRWALKGNTLSMEHLSVKSEPISLVVDNEELDLSRIAATDVPLPRLENEMLPGTATDYRIVSMSLENLVSEAISPAGVAFRVRSTKLASL